MEKSAILQIKGEQKQSKKNTGGKGDGKKKNKQLVVLFYFLIFLHIIVYTCLSKYYRNVLIDIIPQNIQLLLVEQQEKIFPHENFTRIIQKQLQNTKYVSSLSYINPFQIRKDLKFKNAILHCEKNYHLLYHFKFPPITDIIM